ncbi:MAG: cell wall-binding repeat-containing protein [Micrococcales bacterium]|nr:cell wall-binding repeat-containing protein [Micrococcales bacterium]OJX66248.1 MAG: hypothetical protein BGO94_04935 [Micrococcales bacterium 72-143]
MSRAWAALVVVIATVLGVTGAAAPAYAADVDAIDFASAPAGIAVAPLGDRIYVALPDDGRVDAYSASTLTLVASYPTGTRPCLLAVSPDGGRLFVADCWGVDDVVLSIRVSDGAQQAWHVGLIYFTDLVVSPSGESLAVAAGYSVAVLSTGTGAVRRTQYVDDVALGVALLSDAQLVVNTGSSWHSGGDGWGSVRLYDLAATYPIWTAAAYSYDGRVRANPDQTRFYVPSGTGGVDTVMDRYSASRPLGSSGSIEIVISPDGLRAYSIIPGSGPNHGQLRSFRITGDHPDRTWTLPYNPSRLAISPDGRTVWYASAEAHVVARFDVTAPAPATPVVERIGGADRFAAAAGMSRAAYPGGADVVYVASGMNFPDALTAAPAAIAEAGPLLLTASDQLPASVREELTRLDPERVVIVGGPVSVSPAVRLAIRAAVPLAVVEEVSGADRYEVSRNLMRRSFPAATSVYIATGANFPDALSAAPAASHEGSPVLLVPNTTRPDAPLEAIDAPTRDLLRGPPQVSRATIVGGPATLSTDVAYALDYSTPATTSRLWGQDRFGASQAINSATFVSADTVYLASGLTYPDALAGAVLAGRVDAPLYVIPSTCVPRRVLDEIDRLDASRVVVLGGPATLSPAVETLTPC